MPHIQQHTSDIALIHHPDLITDDERRYITAPFTEGGIREWGESEDRDAGKYRGGAPLQMDFVNYTLGRLVKDGDADGYKQVLANIFWRIYDLGYSLDRFGDIDRFIASENWRYDRLESGRKTDRYGKKYSWIAFYELTGFRQDEGLLPEHHDALRILDVDIDPSFPIEQRECNIVTEDFLEDQKISVEEWIFESDAPDMTPYLQVDQFCGERGAWALLDGHIEQKEDQISREIFVFLRGLIVKSKECGEIVEMLKQKTIDEWTLLSCPEDWCTYAGEIPWCDTYPKNSWQGLSFRTESVSVPFSDNVMELTGIEDVEARSHEQDLEIRAKAIKAEQLEVKDLRYYIR